MEQTFPIYDFGTFFKNNLNIITGISKMNKIKADINNN